jgi:Cysteine-rich secretory protein family
MHHRRLVSAIAIGCGLLLAFGNSAAAQVATPAEQISNFRLQHGEGRVTTDSTLNRIAHDQAAAMAARDVLDHSVLGSFSSRVAPSGSGRAAENIAYGYDSFPKTLNQWIESSGHRKNLLLHGASRVGVASVRSSTSGHTYWAMVIAGDYEQPRRAGIRETGIKEKKTATATAQARSSQGCRIKIFSLCI